MRTEDGQACPPGPPRASVLVVDDDSALREALRDLIDSSRLLRVVGAAGEPDAAARLAGEHAPRLAVVDTRMPNGGGTRAAREIRARSPGTTVVAFSAYDDPVAREEMRRAGAVRFVVKGDPRDDLLAVLEEFLR
ncbi:MAG: response regulator transcription factor [Thermoleophilia bacterium]